MLLITPKLSLVEEPGIAFQFCHIRSPEKKIASLQLVIKVGLEEEKEGKAAQVLNK